MLRACHLHLVLVSRECTHSALSVIIMEIYLARELRLQSQIFGDTPFVRLFGLVRWVFAPSLSRKQLLTKA